MRLVAMLNIVGDNGAILSVACCIWKRGYYRIYVQSQRWVWGIMEQNHERVESTGSR